MITSPDKRWSEHIARLKDLPESKSLGISFAIASELFMLKAENMRLRIALKHKGVLEDADINAAAETEEFRKWLQAEQGTFSRSILKAWLETDSSPDTSGEYESQQKVKI